MKHAQVFQPQVELVDLVPVEREVVGLRGVALEEARQGWPVSMTPRNPA